MSFDWKKDAIKERNARWRRENPERHAKANAEWQKKNPHRVRAGVLRRKYNLTPEQYDALFKAQGFHCAICPAVTPGGNGWCVDHCHDTGKVRGILCRSCNIMLGHAKDSPAILQAAIDYLQPKPTGEVS